MANKNNCNSIELFEFFIELFTTLLAPIVLYLKERILQNTKMDWKPFLQFRHSNCVTQNMEKEIVSKQLITPGGQTSIVQTLIAVIKR